MHGKRAEQKGGDLATLRERLKDDIRQLVLGMAPHTRLPSDVELAKQFGGSPDTARLALNELDEEGLVYRVRHRGVFVSGAASQQASVNSRVECQCRIGHRFFTSSGAQEPPACHLCGMPSVYTGRFSPGMTLSPSDLVPAAVRHSDNYYIVSLEDGSVVFTI